MTSSSDSPPDPAGSSTDSPLDPSLDYVLTLVRVFVTDLERAVEFYTNTLGMPLVMCDDELGWAQLDTGTAQLALERFRPEEDPDENEGPLVGRFVALSLAVRDIDAIHQRLVGQGVEFLSAPELMPWGGVLANFYDPDRNVLTLVGPPLGSLRL